VNWEPLSRALGPAKLLMNEPLAKHTSFKIGGPADAFAKPATVAELKICLDFCVANGLPSFFLAGGTNLLVKDAGIRGLTIKLEGEFKEIAITGKKLRAGAGTNLALISTKAGLAGLSGLEFAVGIPGSLGGGLVMNAGAHGGELSQVVTKIGLLEDGAIKEIGPSEAGFEYRNSRFKNSGVLLLWAEMDLKEGNPAEISRHMEEVLAKRKASQPIHMPNAGCVFKNPPGNSAGRLIEEAGLKGLQEGGAQISELHANFVVNLGGAKAGEVLALMQTAREAVQKKFGVTLENEVLVVGEDA
jgi:UDP-N-acetylmuramate dehydrogenase